LDLTDKFFVWVSHKFFDLTPSSNHFPVHRLPALSKSDHGRTSV
jgi:hypothetical protein